MSGRRVVIGVMGPSECDDETATTAEAVGRGIAEAGAVLLCGGRGGVMEAAARGARLAGGTTIGILPGTDDRGTPPNPFIDIAVFTGLGEGRNWVNVCSSDAIVAIPGGYGTLSEIALALKIERPVVVVGPGGDRIRNVAPDVTEASSATEAVAIVFRLLR